MQFMHVNRVLKASSVQCMCRYCVHVCVSVLNVCFVIEFICNHIKSLLGPPQQLKPISIGNALCCILLHIQSLPIVVANAFGHKCNRQNQKMTGKIVFS